MARTKQTRRATEPNGLPTATYPNQSCANCKAKKLFPEEEKPSDWVIVTEGKSFPAYKSLLADRSEVFAKIFESNKETLTIDDMTAAGVQALLAFVWHDNLACPQAGINMNANIAFELLQAGRKYEIDDLVMDSVEMLIDENIDELDAATLFKIFEFCVEEDGEELDCQELQTKVVTLFHENAAEFHSTNQLEVLFGSVKPKMIAQLFCEMSELDL